MAALPRVFHKIFGATGTSDNFGKFGSAKAGSAITTKDLATIMALSAWDTGWQDAIVGSNKAPVLEEMNAHMFVHSTQMGYLFQSGIPEYNASTTYYIGSVVRVGAYWYRSLVDNNIGNTPPAAASDANWIWENQKSALPGDVIEWAGLDVRPGCLWADGAAYNRADYPALFLALNRVTNGTLANGSPIITAIGTTARLGVGMAVEGSNIPSGAKILTVDGANQITLDKNATASITTSLTISPFGLSSSTTFNVPDRRGRMGIGLDNMGGSSANRVTNAQADILGGVAGAEAITLTAAQSGLRDHTHQYTGITVGANNYHTSSDNNNANHGANTSGAVDGGALPASASHDNMAPYISCNYVVKY